MELGKELLPKKKSPTGKETYDAMYDSKVGAHKTVCIYSYCLTFICGSLSFIPSVKSFFVETFHLLWKYKLFKFVIFHICFWILYNHVILILIVLSRLLDTGFTSPKRKLTKMRQIQRQIYKPKPSKTPLNPTPPPSSPILPPSEKKTLLVDLDQTLIFSFTSPPPSNKYSFMEIVVLKFTNHIYYVVKRPGVEQFFRTAIAAGFEIVIFTASSQGYALPILNWLDPHNEFISHKLCRDACTIDANRKYFKDIDVTGRQADQCVIIDDDPNVYWKHYDNMLCIKPFTGDLKDIELHKIVRFFKLAGKFEDLRSAVKFYYSVESYNGENPSYQVV